MPHSVRDLDYVAHLSLRRHPGVTCRGHAAPMARRTAWLHVGLPGTGAPTLAAALTSHADAVAAQGFSLPALSEEQLVRAALELRREHKAWGYRRREVEGAWAEVCRRAHKGRRRPLVVSDLLAACASDQIDLLLDGLSPMRTHVVVSVRDPATQVLDAWAETVRRGRTVSFAAYADRLLDPAREHTQAGRFWASQHLGEVLDRWSAAVGAERVHVVVLPRHEDPVPAAWAGLGRATGLDVSELPLPGRRARRGCLAPGGVAVLRDVNRAVDGRLDKSVHRREAGPWLADALGAGNHPGSPVDRSGDDGPTDATSCPRLPQELHDCLGQLSQAWRDRVVAAGHPVHGDPDDLLPTPCDPRRPLPDEVPAEVRLATASAALADVLVEVARLRRHNAALEERTASLRAKRRRLERRLADATE